MTFNLALTIVLLCVIVICNLALSGLGYYNNSYGEFVIYAGAAMLNLGLIVHALY